MICDEQNKPMVSKSKLFGLRIFIHIYKIFNNHYII